MIGAPPAASPPGTRPISRNRTSPTALRATALAIAIAACVPLAARADDPRVAARSAGGDVATARRIAAALLAGPLPAQLLRVRCERLGRHVDCGLVIGGTKFHRKLDLPAWNAEIAALIDGAFAAAPELDELDVWATVPLDAPHGVVVSGDYAKPTSATVFSITVPRALRGAVRARLGDGRGVFWDPAFRASLAKGTNG